MLWDVVVVLCCVVLLCSGERECVCGGIFCVSLRGVFVDKLGGINQHTQ